MKEKTTFVFNGFLQLSNLDKLDLVNSINEYFDSTERDPIRMAAEERFEKVLESEGSAKCPCCSGQGDSRRTHTLS